MVVYKCKNFSFFALILPIGGFLCEKKILNSVLVTHIQ